VPRAEASLMKWSLAMAVAVPFDVCTSTSSVWQRAQLLVSVTQTVCGK
jgi:hypothetical protein